MEEQRLQEPSRHEDLCVVDEDSPPVHIVVEHCQDCHKHNELSLRHDEEKYVTFALNCKFVQA